VTAAAASPTVLRRVVAVPTPDGATLHATVDGRDDAPVTVVLAHGWTLAQAAYRDLIAAKSKGTVWLAGGCASWYLDKHGHNTTLWPDFTFRFRRLTRKLDRENYVGIPAGAPTRTEVAA